MSLLLEHCLEIGCFETEDAMMDYLETHSLDQGEVLSFLHACSVQREYDTLFALYDFTHVGFFPDVYIKSYIDLMFADNAEVLAYACQHNICESKLYSFLNVISARRDKNIIIKNYLNREDEKKECELAKKEAHIQAIIQNRNEVDKMVMHVIFAKYAKVLEDNDIKCGDLKQLKQCVTPSEFFYISDKKEMFLPIWEAQAAKS